MLNIPVKFHWFPFSSRREMCRINFWQKKERSRRIIRNGANTICLPNFVIVFVCFRKFYFMTSSSILRILLKPQLNFILLNFNFSYFFFCWVEFSMYSIIRKYGLLHKCIFCLYVIPQTRGFKARTLQSRVL